MLCLQAGIASEKIEAHISNDPLPRKNTVSVDQERESIQRPPAHQVKVSEGISSPPAPNAGRSHFIHPEAEVPHREGHKQEVGQRQSTSHCRPHLSGAATHHKSGDLPPPTGPQPTRHILQDRAQSPAQEKAPPLPVPVSEDGAQVFSENNLPQSQNGPLQSEQQQSIQLLQQPATQRIAFHCQPQRPLKQLNQNAQPNNSVLPPDHDPHKSSPSPQCSPSSGQSLSHPTPLLASQPSLAGRGDQPPSEPTSRRDTESTATAPQNAAMKSEASNSTYKHQDFNPNHQPTVLLGNNQDMHAQRGPEPAHITSMPPYSEGQANGTMGPYVKGNHQHISQTNVTRPVTPSAHHTYESHTKKQLHNTAHHPNYPQQGGPPYSYHMQGQHHSQSHPLYPPHQYQQQHYYPQLHPQAQVHNQMNSRGRYPSEEWHQPHYQPHQSVQPNVFLPVPISRGHLKESNLSAIGSEGPRGATLLSPGPVSEVGPHSGGPQDGKSETSEDLNGCPSSAVGSPTKTVHKENLEQPESPKEILDLDSHNAASQHCSQASALQRSNAMAGYIYDPRAVHPGMQQGGVPPPHLMPQAHGSATAVRYPGQPYVDPGCYVAQRPHPHLMEALQRPQQLPQQLPFSPGQTRMAMYRAPRPAGLFQGMMLQQRGLPPEHVIHPR